MPSAGGVGAAPPGACLNNADLSRISPALSAGVDRGLAAYHHCLRLFYGCMRNMYCMQSGPEREQCDELADLERA